MKQKADRLLVWGFILTLFLMLFVFIVLPKERFSELENRVLQKAPQWSWNNLLSRKYAEEAESFVTDHFPLRSVWIAVKSSAEQLRLQQENNGIYKGKAGYLFEKFTDPDDSKLKQYTESINKFALAHPEVKTTFMLAPTSAGMYPDRLPWLAPNDDQMKVNQYIAEAMQGKVSFMDGYKILKPHAAESIYYRTDHHWTTKGAYHAYTAYANKMGWKPLSEKDFSIEIVSHSFLGSYHTRSQFQGVTPDMMEVYKPIHAVSSEVYIADTDETFDSLYDASYLKKKDQYSYFLGGVHALMKITSQLDPQAVQQEKLLVIKDSYAHNFIPFLTMHVPEIHVIDMRYYNGSIGDYMSKHGIKDVLLLFNTATFKDLTAILKLNMKAGF